MARIVHPAWRPSAITTRWFSDKNRSEIDDGAALVIGG
jgi:hypothetical protein